MTSAEQILVIREAAYAARAVLDNATWVARDGSPAMAYRKNLHPRFRDAVMALEALLCHPPETEPEGETTRWRAQLDERTCQPCRDRDGAPAGEGVTRHRLPPHPDCKNPDGCRCTTERGR